MPQPFSDNVRRQAPRRSRMSQSCPMREQLFVNREDQPLLDGLEAQWRGTLDDYRASYESVESALGRPAAAGGAVAPLSLTISTKHETGTREVRCARSGRRTGMQDL